MRCPTLRRVRRLRIAMVFQQFGLLPWRSVRDNVGFGLELRGEPADARKRIIDEQLELVGLSQWAERYVSELSGGMQQRVGLARAFATNADILLMDEPFSALDPLIRGKLQDELLALQERVKKTILFVSHDLDEALKLGDHITILEGGRIVQTGTAEDIVVRPANDYVAEFVTHMNPLSVLTGAMVMRRCTTMVRQEQTIWLDDERRFQALARRLPESVEAVRLYDERFCRMWEFYLAFAMFRLAAIAQGIMGRVIAGTANDVNARARGERARPLAEAGWETITRGPGVAAAG